MIATRTMSRSQLVQATYKVMEYTGVDPTSPLGQEVLQTALTASAIAPLSWTGCLIGQTVKRTKEWPVRGRLSPEELAMGVGFLGAVEEVTGVDCSMVRFAFLIVEDEPIVIPEVIPEGELEVVA